MAVIRVEGSFEAVIEEPPSFFLSFDPNPASAKRPNPIETEVSVHPTGGHVAPVTFQSIYQEGSALYGKVTIVPGTVYYDPATGQYGKAKVSVDISELSSENGAPFGVTIVGWGDDGVPVA